MNISESDGLRTVCVGMCDREGGRMRARHSACLSGQLRVAMLKSILVCYSELHISQDQYKTVTSPLQ